MRFIFLIGVVSLLTSCITTEQVTFKSLDNVQISQENNLPVINFEIGIYNPNNWGLRVKKLEADVFLDESKVGQGSLASSIKLMPDTDTAILVIVRTDQVGMNTILTYGLSAFLGAQKKSTVRVKGNLVLKKFIFRKKIPFDMVETIR